jgi:hypothetical protein
MKKVIAGPAGIKFLNTSVALGLLLSALATTGAVPPPAKKTKQQKISVATRVDRTALWVGDTLRYTVRAVHDPDVEFVGDNLKKESLNLSPFAVRDLSVRQGPFGPNKRLLEVTLILTTYESGQTELRIPPFNLYYFSRNRPQEKAQDTPAETFAVPSTKIGLRSTLAGETLRPRDTKEIRAVAVQEWLVPFVLGLLGMTFLGVVAARRGWAALRAERPKKRLVTRRARERMVQDFLKRAQAMGKESPEDHIRFYAALSEFVRAYVSERLRIDAAGLTPDEIETAVRHQGGDGLGQPAKNILIRCEQVLYARNGLEAAGEWREEMLSEIGRLG